MRPGVWTLSQTKANSARVADAGHLNSATKDLLRLAPGLKANLRGPSKFS